MTVERITREQRTAVTTGPGDELEELMGAMVTGGEVGF